MLWMIANLVFDYILYFVSVYMRKNPLHLTSAQGLFRQTIYYGTTNQKCSKFLQWKIWGLTYSINMLTLQFVISTKSMGLFEP